ncbi:hypothetical protein [Sphingomonas prati]|uniref:Uncharacterized protein n=1 Tax=Sphingomonas prati TaxID=1843237 RepID=A0A7W9F4E1_9SPHN|nr:hypothetical protein [Sphingomonas prati]MBB5730385.1 hypothetical protein [Sphingomonas prati]GGE93686.1 hypothetical protein GCM10011404_28380 [Sphingomonas prati]
MTVIRRLGIGLLAVLALLFVFARYPAWGGDRLVVAARTNFHKGPYTAYAQPWGGDADPLYRYWATYADTMRIDPARFPNNTAMHWRWPPHAPRGAGVWAYDFIAYGNYDGGPPETPVPPRQIDRIRTLRHDFAWTSTGLGRANVLTEFYLRSDPADSESKLLEIGFLLSAPPRTIAFADSGKPIGQYRDAAGREWKASLNEKYVLFLPTDNAPVAKGTLDILAALRWLKAQKLVTGTEWFTGIAIGAEPMAGFGHLQIDRWKVEYE